MPFQSVKQRSWMYANRPDIAKRWAREYPNQGRLPMTAKKQDKRAQTIAAFMKKRKPGEVSDVRSSNPKMGRYKPKSGYAIPYSQDTARSPYKRGNRAN